MRGRFIRAIFIITLMTVGWQTMYGAINSKRVMEIVIGIVICINGETLIFLILPPILKGVRGIAPDGSVFLSTKTYTPQELLKAICPELIVR
jgi:hypothetical protein